MLGCGPWRLTWWCVVLLFGCWTAASADGTLFVGSGAGCQVFVEDMETGAPGWAHGVRTSPAAKAQIADPPGPSSWHLDSATCRGGALSSTMFVSNGNDGPGCSPDSNRDRSQLLSPPIALPVAGNLTLEFQALSFDEAGSCLGSGSFDKHDVGLTTDAGATYTPLNDCSPLADGAGAPTHHSFDITGWAGETVQVIFVYDTVDDRTGHTFAVDDVTVSADVCEEETVLSAGTATITDGWQTVELPHAYIDPVLIAGPASRKGSDPGVVRLRNLGGSHFDVRFQEWNYLDGTHLAHEDFSYLVLPAGRHVMADGSVWEAGTFDHSGAGSLLAVDFEGAFQEPPALFLTAQTANEDHAATVRASGVTSTGFSAALYEEEAATDGHTTETIGYLAVSRGPGWGEVTVNGSLRPYLLQTADVNQQFTPVLTFNLKAEEERSTDAETVHGSERVDVLAIGGHLFAQDISLADADTMTLRRIDADGSTGMEWGVVRDVTHLPTKVPLSRSYTAPVVIVKPVSNRGADPGVLRLDDVRPDSFRVRYQEWNYLNGIHTAENVFFMVVESGTQSIGTAGGTLTVEAGTLNTKKTSRFGGWHTLAFTSGFQQPPAVFSAVQTTNGSDAVTTRNRYVSADSFQLTMQEEDGGDELHQKIETVGWVAIQPGNGVTPNGRKFKVLAAEVGSQPVQVPFGINFARRFPTVVADIGSRFGADACHLRYSTINNVRITLFVQEEQSGDAETAHLIEDIYLFTAQ